MLYSISFLLSVLSLAAWFLFQNDTRWSARLRNLLFGSLAAYGVSVLTAHGALDYKLGIAFRDLIFIGASGLIFLSLARLRKAFWIGAVILAGMLGIYFRFVLLPTFSGQQIAGDIALDPQGELLAEVSNGVDMAKLNPILQKYQLAAQRAFHPADEAATDLDDYLVIDVPADQLSKLGDIKRDLQRSGLIDWLEENEEIKVEPLSNSGSGNTKIRFGINDPGVEQLWGFEAMRIDQLYDLMRKNKIKPQRKAIIAILDTGVDAEHEDIKGNFKSTQSKYDNDPQGHGTHCAGIAAAVSNNGVGVASFSTDNSFVQVTSIKVLNASGMGTQKTIIDGIIEAADKKADVISLSLGGRSNQSRQRAYARAVKYANDKGAIVVAAAGNSNRNAKDYAPVNAPGVIGVSAVDPELQRAVFSNTVQDIKYGIAAPGVNIYSTIPQNKYATYNGTSMATPYVAGLVGLLKSINPRLTTQQVHKILKESGKATKNTRETGEFIQPAEALKEVWD